MMIWYADGMADLMSLLAKIENDQRDNPSMTKAVFRLISRNDRKTSHRATDEELLQEVIDEIKDEYELDVENLDDRLEEDFQFKYVKFVEKTKQKAEDLKDKASYRLIFSVPAFTLGLVMASRVRSHYTHAPWFKVTTLSGMLDVHGTVSRQVLYFITHLIQGVTVYLRVHCPERGIPRMYCEPECPAP